MWGQCVPGHDVGSVCVAVHDVECVWQYMMWGVCIQMFARRALEKVKELVRLEELTGGPLTADTQRTYREARIKAGLTHTCTQTHAHTHTHTHMILYIYIYIMCSVAGDKVCVGVSCSCPSWCSSGRHRSRDPL